MRIILEIPDEEVEIIKRNGFNKDGTFSFKLNEVVKQAIRNGDVLPDNATNGDMIKAIFPKGKVRREVSCTHDKTVFSFPDGTYFGAECRFNTDWWKAPYKGGQDNGNDN